jgi:hypothetical protein
MQDDTLQRTPDKRVNERAESTSWRCQRGSSCDSPRHHDNTRGYAKGCRSGAARADHAEKHRRWRAGETARLVPAIGSARKMQSLVRLGFSLNQLAEEHLFVTRETARRYAAGHYATLFSTTAERIHELWIELSETDDPPTGGRADRTRREAAAKGYEPPEAWWEETIDDPATKPWQRRGLDIIREEVEAHREEIGRRTLVLRQSAEEIATALGTTARSVARHRAALGLTLPDRVSEPEEDALAS